MDYGVFTISLDFELFWGVRDMPSADRYSDHIKGVWQAVPEMLRVFEENGVHATWATVGFLFFDNAKQLNHHLPESLPDYANAELSPYQYLRDQGDQLEAERHFAPQLIDRIRASAGQEIGTHTFSHYYCLEAGQTANNFVDDLRAAISTAGERGLAMKSLVFPRNQWNPAYLPALNELGIDCFRGNQQNSIYRASDAESKKRKLRRALRLLDAYLNLTGHHVYGLDECAQQRPFNFPSSRLLRPYSRKLSLLERFKLRRIKRSMSYAAKRHKIFHLWWHPHNFGANLGQNIAFLEQILAHYATLQASHGMQSLNMGELAELARAR